MTNSKFIHYDRANRLEYKIGDSFENNYIGLPGYFGEFLSWNVHLRWLSSYVYDPEQKPISNLKQSIEELEFSIFGDINRVKLYKDLIFEQVRREKFNDKPSRLYSIFFSEVIRDDEWRELLLKSHFLDSFQYVFEIIEVVKFHKAYTFYFEQKFAFDKYDEIVENAKLYWEGIVPDNKPDALPEVLFVGKATVVDKVLITPNNANPITADF